MKDEIKEILDNPKILMLSYGNYISLDDYVKLKDHITNLQERKITKEDVNKYFKENMCVSFDKFIENWEEQEEIMKYLQEEKENQAHTIKTLLEENERLKNTCLDLTSKCGSLKLVKEATLEYIDKNRARFIKPMNWLELRNILQGEDKDE